MEGRGDVGELGEEAVTHTDKTCFPAGKVCIILFLPEECLLTCVVINGIGSSQSLQKVFFNLISEKYFHLLLISLLKFFFQNLKGVTQLFYWCKI